MKFTTIAKAKKQTGLSYLGYLAPASLSGYNVCSHSTPECRMGCLNTSGRAGIEEFAGLTMIQDARIKKTKLFYEHPEFFMAWLMAEIEAGQRKAKKDGYFFSVRLNCTSDIDWQSVKINGKSIFETYPEISFYDYTKNANKFFDKPSNYHLTLSYTGRNWGLCEVILKRGHNVAMVFNVKTEAELPAMHNGYKVINGDLTDYRIDDAKGIIVGLKWKRIANREAEKQVLNSVFVVTPAKVVSNVQANELQLA